MLGPLEVVVDGRSLALGGTKQRSVLAVLLLNPNRVVSTDRLIEDVWGETAPDEPLRVLQVYVSNVRKLLRSARDERNDEVIETRKPGYLLRAEPQQHDLLLFEELVRSGREALAGDDPASAADSLARALALWRGEALADLGYEPFAARAVARLNEMRLSAIEDRIEAELSLGHHRQVTTELEDLVAEQPLRERLWGQLMIALYRSGRQSDALGAYKQVREALVEQLGIDPSPELQALENAILGHDESLRHVEDAPAAALPRELPAGRLVPMPPEVARRPETTFVGRDPELERLRQHLGRAADEGLQLVVLLGEAGIGKSRLARQLAVEAHAADTSILFGRCDEEPLRPYQPFAEALTQYVASLRANGTPASVAPELWPLVDEPVEHPSSSDTGAAELHDRFRLFEAAASFFGRLAATRPLVLVLDDLHWADAATLILLRHLVRRLQSAPILVLATARDVEPRASADHAFTDLNRELPLTTIRLRGLPMEDVGALLASTTLPGGEAPALARAFHIRTEGNPFFLTELIRHVAESAVTIDPSASRGSALAPERLPLPENVSALIGRRLAGLSDPTRRVLSIAAVVGRRFSIEILQPISGWDEEPLLDALEEAQASGVIFELPDAMGVFTFSHGLVREVLYGGMTRVRRARLHGRVAETMEELHPDGAQLVEVAYHFAQAGDTTLEQAARAAWRAGDYAMSRLGYDEAAELYQQALGALDRLEPGAPVPEVEDRTTLEYRGVLALARAGATDRAQELFETLPLDTEGMAAPPPELAEDLAALGARLAKDRALAATGEERQGLARTSAEGYEAIFDRLRRPYSCINAATMWLLAGHEDRAEALARSALELARSLKPQSESDAYWLAATEAEAALLLGDHEAVAGALQHAASLPSADLAARMTTYRQLNLICGIKGVDATLLSALAIPPTLATADAGEPLDGQGPGSNRPARPSPRVRGGGA